MKQSKKSGSPLLVSKEYLTMCLKVAEGLGIELKETLDECGIEQRLLNSPEGLVAVSQLIELMELVAERFNCPHFGFMVGKHLPSLKFGVLSPLLKLSPTVKSAIENFLPYGQLYSEVGIWNLRCENDYAYLTRIDRNAYHKGQVQWHTCCITRGFNLLQSLCGSHWRATSISFAHAAPSESKHYERYFQCPVYFDQEFEGVVFPAHYLQHPIKTADPELLDIVKAHLTSLLEGHDLNDDIATKVRFHIRQRLGTNGCNMQSVAQLLDMHPRAFQRELKKYNCTFKSLLSDTRHEVAEHYLRNSTIQLAELAILLGYKNVSGFSLAFKNKSGSAPDHWRKSLSAQKSELNPATAVDDRRGQG